MVSTFADRINVHGLTFIDAPDVGFALLAGDMSDGTIVEIASDGSQSIFADGFRYPRDFGWGRGGPWGTSLFFIDLGPYSSDGSAKIYKLAIDGTATLMIDGLNVTDHGSGQIAFGPAEYCYSLYIADYSSRTGARIVKVTPPTLTCGDGTTDTCEECDDGNRVAGDGCDPSCFNE